MNKKRYWNKISVKDRIILDLCGGTGSWSKPYKDAGYNVKIITLPEYDIFDSCLLKTEGKKSILSFPQNNTSNITFIDINKVYGIFAAPTCTHFSLARTTAKTPRDLKGAFKLVQCCLDIIYNCVHNETLMFWALENPLGLLRRFLGRPPITVNPYEYAGYSDNPENEAYTKKTDIWGDFTLPKQKIVKLTKKQQAACSMNNRNLPAIPETYVCDPKMSKQAIKRSITPSGFARAFYKSNK